MNEPYLDQIPPETRGVKAQHGSANNLNATQSQQTIRYSAANNLSKDFFGAVSMSQSNQQTPFAIVNLKKGNQNSSSKPSKKDTGDNYFTGIKPVQQQRASGG